MTERNQRPQRIEDQPRVHHAIVVQLPKVLNRRDPLLVILEVIPLHPDPNVLENVVDDRDAEIGVVALEVVQEDGEEMDIGILDFPDFDEGVVEFADDLSAGTRERSVRRDGKGTRQGTGKGERGKEDAPPDLPSATSSPTSTPYRSSCG